MATEGINESGIARRANFYFSLEDRAAALPAPALEATFRRLREDPATVLNLSGLSMEGVEVVMLLRRVGNLLANPPQGFREHRIPLIGGSSRDGRPIAYEGLLGQKTSLPLLTRLIGLESVSGRSNDGFISYNTVFDGIEYVCDGVETRLEINYRQLK